MICCGTSLQKKCTISFMKYFSIYLTKTALKKTVKVKKLDLDKPYIVSDIKAVLREKHRLQKLFTRKPITY